MQKYVKLPCGVEAEPVTLLAYNEFKGWKIPADENPCDEGYKITRPDGTITWEAKELFESNHREFDETQLVTVTVIKRGMIDFPQALYALKAGNKLARKGWNGKGMYVQLNKGMDFKFSELCPFLTIKNARNSFDTWVPSISDLLAEDWQIV